MKKKLMMVAVLLGALTLGACVDDNESASVTAVRNAKAKQLESVAALNNANAEAAKILAAADAKLKEAEAAYQQALANAKENETAFLKEKYVLELQKIKAEYEADIARAKADAAKADKDAWDDADSKLTKLYTAYSNAIDKVSELNGDLIDAKLTLAQIDIDAITGKVYWDNFVAKQNKTIAEKTAEIERLKALNVADKADLLKKMNDLSTTGYNLNKDKVVAEKVVTDAEKVFNEAVAPTLPSKSFDLPEQNHEQAAWMAIQLPYAKAVAALQEMEYTYRVYGKFVTSTSNEIVIDGCPELGTYKTYAPSASGDVMEATQTVTNALNGTINTIVANIGVPSVKDKSAATGTYLQLEQSEASLKTAKENLAAEQKKETPDKDLIAQYTLDIENANINIEKANNRIASLTEDLAAAKTDLKEFNDILAIVKEGSAEQKAYAEAIKAIVPAGEAYLTATHKVHEIDNAIAIIGITSFNDNGEPADWKSGEYSSVKSLYEGTIDVATLIASCNEAIADAKANIASGSFDRGHYETVSYLIYNPFTERMEERLTSVWIDDATVVVSNEDAKKLAQLEIDAFTAKIKVQETLVAKYKAELDAALAAE